MFSGIGANEAHATLGVLASKRMVNRDHPVVQYLFSEQETVVDEPQFNFFHSLVSSIVEDGVLEALANGDFAKRQYNANFSNLGFYFRHIRLDELPENLRPPYQCWIPNTGFFNITAEFLTELSKIQLIDWNKRREPRFI